MDARTRRPETRVTDTPNPDEWEIVSPDDRTYYGTIAPHGDGYRVYDDGGLLTNRTFGSVREAHEWFRAKEL